MAIIVPIIRLIRSGRVENDTAAVQANLSILRRGYFVSPAKRGWYVATTDCLSVNECSASTCSTVPVTTGT